MTSIVVQLVGFRCTRTRSGPNFEAWFEELTLELKASQGGRVVLVESLVGSQEGSGDSGKTTFRFGPRSRQVLLMKGFDEVDLNLSGGQADRLITEIEKNLAKVLEPVVEETAVSI